MSIAERRSAEKPSRTRGRLRIGDDWNAITIIALSQSSPLKALAELVENSIDAKASKVTITRGREHGRHFLSVRDDGEGVARDGEGRPDFRYVATHICDSVKRRLKADAQAGVQGEFGIGLLSFWTLGDELTMTSTGVDQRPYQMIMRKGDPSYAVAPKRTLFGDSGTEVRIAPLLEGVRALSGEKIQWYLAAELRDRIRQTGVRITVVDRLARKQYAVEPRQYEGRLLHQLPAVRTPLGDIYVELYLNEPAETNCVALYRHGTRVIEDIAGLDAFAHPPWTLRYLQGHVDTPFLNLTPSTRSGFIHDAAYAALCQGLVPLERKLVEIIEEQRRAEEEQASREQMRAIQRAFREALLALPAEEYDWFAIHARTFRSSPPGAGITEAVEDDALSSPGGWGEAAPGAPQPELAEGRQRQFFEFAGPLFSVAVSPASSIVRVGEQKELRALPRDRSRRRVELNLEFQWRIVEGPGTLTATRDQAVTFLAPAEPGLARIEVSARQNDVVCAGEGLVTVTHELLAQLGSASGSSPGLPGYTFERAPGESWRSRFDPGRNLIIVNNGHRDFVYASRSKALKLRYLVRLYAKELVIHNFVGLPADQLLERMVELSLRTEEHL
ncbi:MAG TPA: ATP-binding protein [Xanthobacteraceae bacterium]|nr:ATP-binding protein [Xanthobacteraceae bacterium]